MNWHHWYWWTWPAAIAIGFAWSFVLMCLIPPRISARDWLLNWKGAVSAPIASFRRSIRAPRGRP